MTKRPAPVTKKPAAIHRAKHREPEIKPEIRTEIVAILLFAVAILLFIGLIATDGGLLGGIIKNFLIGLVGFGAYTLPFVALTWGLALLLGKNSKLSLPKFFMYLGIFVIVISFIHMRTDDGIIIFNTFGERAAYLYGNKSANHGGFIGGTAAYLLTELLRPAGAYIALITGFIVLFIMVTGKSFFNVLVRILTALDKQISKINDREYDEYGEHDNDEQNEEQEFKYDPRADDGYVYETRGKHERAKPKPVSPITKLDTRKVFDYIMDDEDGEEDDYSDVIVEFRKHTAPAEDEYDEEYVKEYDDEDEYDEIAEDYFIIEPPEHEFIPEFDPEPIPEPIRIPEPESAWESSISIKGIGVEGYVPITVTTDSSDDFVESVFDKDIEEHKLVRVTAEPLDDDEEGEQKPYILPPVDMLDKNTYIPSPSSKAQILENSRKLEETLKSFGVEARVVSVSTGPTVTRYELSPGVGVKVSKISNLADDLALNLAALGIRIEAPVPGKSVVGIEIPNNEVQTVFLRDVVDGDAFRNYPSRLGFAIGQDIAGNSVIVDIAKMPHLLIAGATGAGKSVCINTIIASILFKSTPDEVKMLMIDPKVVELNVYNGIPHLEIPVVTDPQKAAGALSWGVREMNDRYNAFARTGTRDLKGYNETLISEGTKPLPQIIIIIDELADLMMSCKADVEQNICRLAQKARAAGIHLIIATQRPSVDVITGLIKANVPSRLAFAVTSGTDSRTILDMVGAEKLLGKGDMLFSPAGLAKPQRIQGAYISDKEVERLVTFIKEENGVAVYDEDKIERITANDKDSEDDDFGGDVDDEMRKYIEFITDRGKASVSMLQRQFRIGYPKAARIMDEMEKRGIVGPEDGSKPRKVLSGRFDD